ncbi:C4-dicarboxylate transport sensor protein DctB [Roseimaritima multifibrata]|uniref:histidine kinase n=1 Tax=Roseimaritima multifibrata TaxID=1930274 RepID=A0A517MLE5_9BACT|nr:ATP-binding protein [Roseimaritima multifibrata]QDS95699.1 C4-dicarboxylate transport sensor protein DctB [Roseimaritima multifibrata]
MAQADSTNLNRILVIDDNPAIHDDFRKILQGGRDEFALEAAEAAIFGESVSSLEKNVYEVDSAYQGEEGLRKVLSAIESGRPYGLAFVDMRMPPGWDGIQTIQKIWSVAPSLNVVICTAFTDYTWPEIIDQLGISDRMLILKKPFDNCEVAQLAATLTKRTMLEAENKAYRKRLEDRVEEQSVSLTKTAGLLSQSKEFLQSTLDALTTQVAIIDSRGIILALNAAWESTAPGGSPLASGECVVGANYLTICKSVPEPFRQQVAPLVQHLEAIIANQKDSLFREYKDVTKPSGSHWYTVRAARFHDADETRIVVSHDNVTEYKQLQAQLAQAQKLESIGQIAAGIAHEINSPMQYIGDNIECLQEWAESYFQIRSGDTEPSRVESLQEKIRASLEDCKDGYQRVTGITQAMKQFSHPGKNQKESTDINELVRSAATITRNRWKYVADLTLDLGDRPLHLTCNIAGVNQVLLNLIVNASDAIAEKYGDNPEHKGTLQIRTIDHADVVEIQIADSGAGIPATWLGRVFDPFFTTKDVGKGTGQGLTICYDVVVNVHHGELSVESEPGQGTVFTVLLPKQPVEEPEIEFFQESTSQPFEEVEPAFAEACQWGDTEDLIG